MKHLAVHQLRQFLLVVWIGGIPTPGVPAEPAAASHGFSYKHEQIREKPWSIHIVKIDRAAHQLELDTTLGGGDRFGLATLSDQVRTIPASLGRPLAAINGDYFQNEYPYQGAPKGLQILHGELVSAPSDWTCFWSDAQGQPHMTNVTCQFSITWPNGVTTPFRLNEERSSDGVVLFTHAIGTSTQTSGGRELVLEPDGASPWLPLRAGETYSARVREVRETGPTRLTKDTLVVSLSRRVERQLPKLEPGAIIKISTATSENLKGAKTAIGGGPPIVRGGVAIGHDDSRVRHPRTALGWNKTHFFLVEVDGRQRYLSVGMTVSEISEYMVKLGCEEAMSLDGGGSATFWVAGQVMNSPSEGRERDMANALVVLQKKVD